MKKNPPNQYRRRNLGAWSSTDEDGNNGAFQIPLSTNGLGQSILANCIISDGMGWEHVSVHVMDIFGIQQTPNWEQMCQVKDIFWDPEECVVQFHPPKSEYVNNHSNVLHLWKWTGGEFPRPNSLLVGIKDLGVIK